MFRRIVRCGSQVAGFIFVAFANFDFAVAAAVCNVADISDIRNIVSISGDGSEIRAGDINANAPAYIVGTAHYYALSLPFVAGVEIAVLKPEVFFRFNGIFMAFINGFRVGFEVEVLDCNV